MTQFKIASSNDSSIHESSGLDFVRSVACVDVAKYMKPRPNPQNLIVEVRATQMNRSRTGDIEVAVGRRMGDENVNPARDRSPALNQFVLGGVICES